MAKMRAPSNVVVSMRNMPSVKGSLGLGRELMRNQPSNACWMAGASRRGRLPALTWCLIRPSQHVGRRHHLARDEDTEPQPDVRLVERRRLWRRQHGLELRQELAEAPLRGAVPAPCGWFYVRRSCHGKAAPPPLDGELLPVVEAERICVPVRPRSPNSS